MKNHRTHLRWRPGHLVAGSVLVAAYDSLGSLVPFGGNLGQDFVFVGSREAMFWLAHSLLLVPGLLLLAVGSAGPLTRGLAHLGLGGDSGRAPGNRWWLLGGYGLLLLALAVLGRDLLLLDLPISNDEYSVDFGGRMLAEGVLSVPLPDAAPALPLYFTFRAQDRLSSMDFPGPIVWSAAARASGTGDVAYAILAAVSGLAIVAAARHLAGVGIAVATALLWLVSPMVWSLSLTTHAHLLSRSFIALAVLAYLHLLPLRAEGGPPRRPVSPAIFTGCALGICAGMAFLCRPFETTALLFPMALHLLYLAWPRSSGLRRPVAAAAMTWSLAGGGFALYNTLTTGAWYLPARFAAGAASHTATHLGVWDRLGMNMGWNVMMLAIWCLGPLGLGAVYLGLQQAGPVWKVLGGGAALHLALALAHEDSGLHSVGPIHYSESAVPLILLAAAGVGAAWRWLAAKPAGPGLPAALGLAWGIALISFGVTHARILRLQAEINHLPFDAVAGLERPSVVIAEPPGRLLQLRDDLAAVGTWVAELPSPDPFLRDEVIFVYPRLPVASLASLFPERDLYQLTYRAEGDPLELRLLRRAGATSP